jgi:succinate-semialdehyde dehydrogenase/glutarate-semialdehyde dehydrogenase
MQPDPNLTRIAAHAAGPGDLYIGGEWTGAADGRRFAVHDPSSAALIREVDAAGPTEARAAVDAAAKAGTSWAALAPTERADILYAAYRLMLAHQDSLAWLISLENGKTLPDAHGEVGYSARFLRWFAEEAVRIGSGFAEAPTGGYRHVVVRRPVGVTAHVTPWNFPAAMAVRKLAPALAAGCTALLKPAPETPLTALAIAELLAEAGLPAGVVNVLPTDQAAAVVGEWMWDQRVRKISFTGSTATGRLLLSQAAEQVKNTTMELGGNAPFVVCADADVDAAVLGAMEAKLRGGGQVCVAANRFYVHAAVAEEFTAKLAEAMAAVKVGPGLADGSELGPMITPAAVERMAAMVEDAEAKGARVVVRGTVPEDGDGWYFPPLVLADVPDDARLMQEEVFGPVAPIAVYEDEADLVRRATATEFGLAAYVYSRDAAAGLRLALRLETGMAAVNRGMLSDPAAPFGGVKQSGLGREGGREGIEAFLETAYVALDWPSTTP